jgi:hypothetical protein
MASNPGGRIAPGTKARLGGAPSARELPACCPGGARCRGGVSSSQALARNRRTCRPDSVFCKDANRRGDFGQTSFDFLGYTFRGRLARGPRGYFTGFNPAISGKAKKAKGQQIRGLAPQPAQQRGPARPRGPDQPASQRLGQLLRGLLPLRVALPRMADQRAPRPLGHAKIQAIPRQVRQGDGMAAEGLPAPARPVRPPAANRVHRKPDFAGRCGQRSCPGSWRGRGRPCRRPAARPRPGDPPG